MVSNSNDTFLMYLFVLLLIYYPLSFTTSLLGILSNTLSSEVVQLFKKTFALV